LFGETGGDGVKLFGCLSKPWSKSVTPLLSFGVRGVAGKPTDRLAGTPAGECRGALPVGDRGERNRNLEASVAGSVVVSPPSSSSSDSTCSFGSRGLIGDLVYTGSSGSMSRLSYHSGSAPMIERPPGLQLAGAARCLIGWEGARILTLSICVHAGASKETASFAVSLLSRSSSR